MAQLSVLSVIVYLLAYTVSGSSAQPAATAAAETAKVSSQASAMAGVELSKSVNTFAGELLQQVHAAAPANTNLILSPFSVQTALGLALLGATGQTYTSMRDGLKLGAVATGDSEAAQRSAIAGAFHTLLAPLTASPMLRVANKIYVQNAYHIRPAFEKLAKEQFASAAETVNFADAAPAAAAINTWVEKQTNDRIKDLISADSLSADTRAVLVNAIYFKGEWKSQFPADNTHKAPFYTAADDASAVDVDMMYTKEKFLYGELSDLDAKVIELPYKDSDISMVIVLPNKRDGLAELVQKLSGHDLGPLRKNMYKTDVEVSLPKFKVEYEVKLPEVLKKMGMATMFSDAATFGELLVEEEPLQISDVVHKAFIEVNEEGAEAAAATGVLVMTRSMPLFQEVQFFRAEHPFYYAIANVASKTPLCVGTLSRLPAQQ